MAKKKLRKYLLLSAGIGLTILMLILWVSVITRPQIHDHQKISLSIDDHLLQVEVVNSSTSITKGLGNRSEIGSDGMLFLFDRKQQLVFWMKDMYLDLDFVWIADGKIVDLTENVPAPKNAKENLDQNLKLYRPSQDVDMVLEIPAGTIQKFGFQLGEKIQVH